MAITLAKTNSAAVEKQFWDALSAYLKDHFPGIELKASQVPKGHAYISRKGKGFPQGVTFAFDYNPKEEFVDASIYFETNTPYRQLFEEESKRIQFSNFLSSRLKGYNPIERIEWLGSHKVRCKHYLRFTPIEAANWNQVFHVVEAVAAVAQDMDVLVNHFSPLWVSVSAPYPSRGGLGMLKGKFRVSDDFDEPMDFPSMMPRG